VKLPRLLSLARHHGDPMYAEREKWVLRLESLGLTPRRARAREAQRWAMWQALCRDDPSLRVSDVGAYADFNRRWFEAQWRPGRARQPHGQARAASAEAPASLRPTPATQPQAHPAVSLRMALRTSRPRLMAAWTKSTDQGLGHPRPRDRQTLARLRLETGPVRRLPRALSAPGSSAGPPGHA
jgi:hypothetical protein